MALKPCKECKKDVSDKAKTCPHCGVKNPTITATQNALGCLFVVVLAALAMTYCSLPSEPETPAEKAQKEKSRCENKTSAYLISQKFVKDRLKSPATADFPYMDANDVTVSYQGNCKHKVRAYVDSQNSFGATVRTKYYMELQTDPAKETWRVLDIEM